MGYQERQDQISKLDEELKGLEVKIGEQNSKGISSPELYGEYNKIYSEWEGLKRKQIFWNSILSRQLQKLQKRKFYQLTKVL